MTNKEIRQIALRQSALESSCLPEDFERSENRVVLSECRPGARKYLQLPFLCDLTSYGSNLVASVSPVLEETVRDYIGRYPVEHCFETPNLHVLMEKLKPFGCNVCFMAEYFLPDVNRISAPACLYPIRFLRRDEFASLYLPEWSNALCEQRRELDCLAVGAYDRDRLIGLAGCSADCDSMWQIGVDVLPDYRRRGIAASLTGTLAIECLKRNIVPFYCSAWSNLRSVRNALRSGFRPAWIQLTVKENAHIDRLNRIGASLSA